MCASFFSSRLSRLWTWTIFGPTLNQLEPTLNLNLSRLSRLQGFELEPSFAGHISSYRCARNFDIVKLKFFVTSLPCKLITHILLKKTAIHSLVCLLKSFTFDHLCTYIIQTSVNSLTISLTEWPENQKNRCLSFSANSVGLHFRDRVEKIEENGKKRK